MYNSISYHVIKKVLINFAFTIFVFTSTGLTRTMDLPPSPNLIGSGSRAMGMGGSFISIADDATAASWNPGGLIQHRFL